MAKTQHLRPILARLHRAQSENPAPDVFVPAQPTATHDHYTWAVNAAVESGQLDLVDDIAASYAREA
jgi:hypothetical protein